MTVALRKQLDKNLISGETHRLIEPWSARPYPASVEAMPQTINHEVAAFPGVQI
jgi:hypothetical protein